MGVGALRPQDAAEGTMRPQFYWVHPMPNKRNADRRHHIPKMSFKVQTWPEYEIGLRRQVATIVATGSPFNDAPSDVAAAMAAQVGAVTLARAVDDPAVAERIAVTAERVLLPAHLEKNKTRKKRPCREKREIERDALLWTDKWFCRKVFAWTSQDAGLCRLMLPENRTVLRA